MSRRGSGFSLVVFRSLSGLVCLATSLSASRSRAWWARASDFPRLQIAALGALGLGAGWLSRRHCSRTDRCLAGLTTMAVATQLGHFAKYTRLFPKEVVRKGVTSGTSVSILTANVRMRNREVERVVSLIKARVPDLVLLLETNSHWAKGLEVLNELYPYRVVEPLENTYGLILLSRLPLVQPEVRYLVQKDVPSIRTRVRLANGSMIWFYGLHPRPPVRGSAEGEVELPGSGPRDAELVVAAMEIRELKVPVIVAGDFNDVAWSHTTRRFQRLSGTLDPRVGRGLYPTFHTGSRLLRFPLDHLFISEHFALRDFRREPDIGSDHFPLYAGLILTPKAEEEQEPPETKVEDLQEAVEVVEGEKDREA